MVMSRGLGGKHAMQCIDDGPENCAPETCVVLLTSVSPINSIKTNEMQKIKKKDNGKKVKDLKGCQLLNSYVAMK